MAPSPDNQGSYTERWKRIDPRDGTLICIISRLVQLQRLNPGLRGPMKFHVIP